MNTTTIILLSVHLVFSIVCGLLIWRAYEQQSTFFFKGFLRTLIFGFAGALYFLKNFQPNERKELQIACIVALVCILFASFASFMEGYRTEFLILAMFVAGIVHGLVKWKKLDKKSWKDWNFNLYGTYMLSFISVSPVCLVLYLCLISLFA